MKRAMALALAAAGALHGETSQERGKKVLDACVEALGGDRFLEMRNRVEHGMAFSFYREEVSGLTFATIYTEYSPKPAPGKLAVRERQNFGKKNEYGSVLFGEGDAYEMSYRGAQPLSTERFDRYRDSTLHDIFYILRQRREEPGMLVESKGFDVLDNRPVDIVDITDRANQTTTVYIDQTTHLPTRQVFHRRNPVTKDQDEEVTVFTKYRDVGGVQWPFTIQRNRNGEKVYQMFSDSVKIDQSLPADLFQLPSGIKMMKGS